MNISENFWKANKPTPNAKTVGSLRALLELLPDELKLGDGGVCNDGYWLTVYNHGDEDVHLQFEDDDPFAEDVE